MKINSPCAVSLYERAITRGNDVSSMKALAIFHSKGADGVEKDAPFAASV